MRQLMFQEVVVEKSNLNAFNSAVAEVKHRLSHVRFGEVGVKFVIHDNMIRRVELLTNQKLVVSEDSPESVECADMIQGSNNKLLQTECIS